MSETRTLHFSIQGEYVTDTARNMFYQKNDFIGAIQLIMDATVTDQMTEEQRFVQACKILNGNLKLTGVYPGDNYGVYEDTPDPQKTFVQKFNRMRVQITEQEDQLRKLNCKLELLYDVLPRDTKNLINDKLDDYGEDPLFTPTCNPTANNNEDDEPINFMGQVINQDTIQDTLEHLKSQHTEDDYGWLSPTGKFYPSEFGTHTASAIKLAKKYYSQEYKLHTTQADTILYSHGWVLMHNPMYGTATPSHDESIRKTKKQIDFIYEYYTKRNKPGLADRYLQELA